MATPTLTLPHRWVKYSIEAVDVIVAPDGLPFFTPKEVRSIGEQVGCAVCSEPLTSGSVITHCLGLPE